MTAELDYRDYWERAFTFDRYVANEVETNRSLWEGIYKKSRTPESAIRRAAEIGGRWKLLVLSEAWCGDASNSVPVLARFAEDVPNFELRIIKRDENLELMDRYLTDGSRSIPISIILDEAFQPIGACGPRPVELQEFVLGEKAGGVRPNEEIYVDTRRWYARGKGETTLRELLQRVGAAMVMG
jgi:hypothetical protein